jgi:hypothetical protein
MRELLYESPAIKWGDKAVPVEVPLSGFKSVGILVTDPDNSTDRDHADVLEPVLIKKDGSEVSLTEISPYKTFQGWRTLATDKTADGNPLRVAGTLYKKGLGTHGIAEIWYYISDEFVKVKFKMGVDDESNGTGSSTVGVRVVGIR